MPFPFARKDSPVDLSQAYILAAIVLLGLIVLILVRSIHRPEVTAITPLGTLAFGFMMAGLFLIDYRWPAYGLLSIGVILTIVDMNAKEQGGI
jgi:membrane-bound ClpP family serine protease